MKRIFHANLFMHTTSHRFLFVAIILNVPETQFLHCPILFCMIFIIIFCSKCLINWVKSCIYFAYWLIQATHYLPVDLHNFALKLMQMPKFRCIQTQITQVPKFRQMYGVREYTPPIDRQTVSFGNVNWFSCSQLFISRATTNVNLLFESGFGIIACLDGSETHWWGPHLQWDMS